MARLHQYISMATTLLWTGQPDTPEMLGLALNTCAEPGDHALEQQCIAELLVCARDLWRLVPKLEADSERMRLSRLTLRLIHLADIIAVTAGT
jgi:hypothetical protein